MNKTRLKQRLQAGLVHLCASILIAGAAAALIFFAWYPSPLAEAQGVSRLLLVLIGVDVAIGPLITVIVFDRRKKSLKYDLATVVALQLGALVYGLHSIYEGRPALIVFNVDRFDAVAAGSLELTGLKKAKEEGKPGLPWLRPRIVGARIPADPAERHLLMLSSAQGGADLPELAQYHVPYSEITAEVQATARPLSELKEVNDLDESRWQALLQSLSSPQTDLAYLPLKAKVRDCVVIVNRRNAEVIRILPLQPKWRRP